MMRLEIPVSVYDGQCTGDGRVVVASHYGRDPSTLVDRPYVMVEAPCEVVTPAQARAFAAALVACADEAEREARARR